MTENRDLPGLFRLPKLKSALGRTTAVAAELARQVREGIQQPLSFPGFGKFLFSGDRVVLAVHSGIAEVELVLNPLLDELLGSGGLVATQVTLLFADRLSAERFASHVKPRDRSPVAFVHEGTSEHALALLGADDGDLPILVNRLIFDADVLIPIIRASDQERSSRQPVIWDFVDSGTKKRWRSQMLKLDEAYGNHISELAGTVVVIEVVIGPGDFPYDVVIGTPTAADVAAAERLAVAWRIKTPDQIDLVIATIDDRRDRGSWQAIRDAIVVVAEIGKNCPIVIVSDVGEPPPNELRGVFSAHTAAGSRTTSFDSALHSAIEGRTVYLSSKLSADVVHDLGMMSIAGVEEVASLATRFAFPVLLRDSQRVRTNAEGSATADVKKLSSRSKGSRAPSPPPLPRGGGEGTKIPARRGVPRGAVIPTTRGRKAPGKRPAKKATRSRRKST